MNTVSDKLCNAMNVKELRELLSDFDDDAPVVFVCSYGDYHNTQQALTVGSAESYESCDFEKSAYSRSEIALNKSHQDYDSEYFCPKCEDEMDISPCPKCGTTCIDEEGNQVCEEDISSLPVVVLTM